MKVEIVSPEQKLLEAEVDMVAVPGVNGEFEMLENHAPIISLLQKGFIRIKGKNIKIDEDLEEKFIFEKDQIKLPVNGGALEMKNNHVIILVE